MSEEAKETTMDDMKKKAEEIQAKIDNPEFKINATDASQGGPFVDAFHQFEAAPSRAWLEMELLSPEFRGMAAHDKIGALVNGTLAGVIAMVMSKLDEDHQDKAIEYVRNCVEPAGVNAAGLIVDWKKSVAQFAREKDGFAPDAKLN